jgi:glycosyltransferase involved in cell wall biosynthesis
MNKIRILSITTSLARYGGAQKVLLDLHHGIETEFECRIIGFQSFDKIHPKFGIRKSEYIQLKNLKSLKILRNATILVHARNVIPLIVVLKKILFLKNTRIIYVSHNVYNTYKRLTLFPNTIVSISNKVTENLMSFFNRKRENIHLIYNGIDDKYGRSEVEVFSTSDKIKILYPARVNKVKRQLEIVENLKGNLSDKIEIHFAGVGDDYEKLKELCETTNNFEALGFVEDMDSLIKEYHYVMLYSFQEGLPIALIEGIMYGKPLLVNDIGGNLEIGVPGMNAIELQGDWNVTISQLNELCVVDELIYQRMCLNSRRLFLEKFKIETMVSRYKELILSVQDV